MHKPSLLRSLAAVLAGSLLLASCGGGGGGGGGTAPAAPVGTSAQFSEAVAGCAVETQKSFVRAYLDEVYLWYREIPAVDPAPYTTVGQVDDYFDALTNLPKDEFSTAVFRGETAPVQALLAASQPEAGNLLAEHAVPTAPAVFPRNGRTVGYVQLRNHDEGAQDELITAFTQMQSQGVNELILDLRDNLGGFVYVALTAASMITGPAVDGQVFERLVFNDKRGETSLQFRNTVQFQDQNRTSQYPVGTALPRLSLPRVFILTNPNTCSASESIINSLRGIGVQAIRIGDTTCGKPYGFTEKPNCGWSFFAIEFQGFNAAGFGDYQAGFEPMCRVEDTSTLPTRGTAGDPVFNAALTYIDTNACPAGTVTGIQSASAPILRSKRPPPAGASRVLPAELLPR